MKQFSVAFTGTCEVEAEDVATAITRCYRGEWDPFSLNVEEVDEERLCEVEGDGDQQVAAQH